MDIFLLETDASGYAVGALLLTQRNGAWLPVEAASVKLKKHEKNWPVRDREAFAIVFGLKKFDCYIRGRSVQIHTDHKSLQW